MNPHRRAAREGLISSTQSVFDKIIAEARLTPRQQEIIIMRYVGGRLNYQIAQELNVSQDTVGIDIQKAHDKIYKAMKELDM